MRVTSVQIEYGRTINLGDYNNIRVVCMLGADLDDGETAEDALEQLWEQARESVRAQVARVVKRRPAAQRSADEADELNGEDVELDGPSAA